MDYRILVPIDFTEITENSLRYAIGAAKSINTGIYLLHIVNNEMDKIKATSQMDAMIYNYESVGIPMKHLIKVGNIYEDISKTAEELNCGIIFMGTHGMKGLQRVFGSYALRVITKSKVPFIITQGNVPKDNDINDIVVPIDMGIEDKQVLTTVIRSSHIFKAKVHLFVNKRKDEFHENAVGRNLAFSKKYLSDHNVDFTISHTNGMDQFDRELVRFSQNIGADMLAIVHHHDGGLANLLGSNFDQNVITNDANIPVLIIDAVDPTRINDIFSVFG